MFFQQTHTWQSQSLHLMMRAVAGKAVVSIPSRRRPSGTNRLTRSTGWRECATPACSTECAFTGACLNGAVLAEAPLGCGTPDQPAFAAPINETSAREPYPNTFDIRCQPGFRRVPEHGLLRCVQGQWIAPTNAYRCEGTPFDNQSILQPIHVRNAM